MNNNTEPDLPAPDEMSGSTPTPDPTAPTAAATPPTAATQAGNAGPGDPGAGYAGPGYPGPGYAGPGYAPSGSPGTTQAGPTYPPPGYPNPGYPNPGYPSIGGPAQEHAVPAGPQPVRRLTRSRHDRVLAGVCGGLARYWNTDALLLRILLIVLTLATGGALLIGYLIAWLVIPQDTDEGWPGSGGGYAAGGNPAYGPGEATGGYVPPTAPRSYLGLIALSASVLVAGVIWMLGLIIRPAGDVAGFILTSMLIVLGIGMIVGAWYGRARWLAFLAVPLMLMSMAAVAAHNVLDEPGGSAGVSVGTRQWTVTPQEASGTPLRYQVTAGDATLDLTGLTATAAAAQTPARVTISARVGLGQLVVRIPADMRLDLDASLRAGQILLPGESTASHEGTDVTLETTLNPTAGKQPAYIVTLDATLGAGNLEVHRDAA
jgi:phage shock protein PspC (stress-responsive transcriptional regulator)